MTTRLVDLTTVDGQVLATRAPSVTLTGGALALRADVEVPGRVLVDGLPATVEVVRSGRRYDEACGRLALAAGWRGRVLDVLQPRRRDRPVLLAVLDEA